MCEILSSVASVREAVFEACISLGAETTCNSWTFLEQAVRPVQPETCANSIKQATRLPGFRVQGRLPWMIHQLASCVLLLVSRRIVSGTTLFT